jgi:hypothetical protein
MACRARRKEALQMKREAVPLTCAVSAAAAAAVRLACIVDRMQMRAV